MRKIIFLLAVVGNLCFAHRQNVFGESSASQDSLTNQHSALPDLKARELFFYTTLGFSDFFGLGIGYQPVKDYSFSLKWSVQFTHSADAIHGLQYFPSAGGGGALGFAKHLKGRLLNTLKIDAGVFFFHTNTESTYPLRKGGALEVSAGHDNIQGSGFGPIYFVGFMWNFARTVTPAYVLTAKIGIKYDIILKDK